MAELNRFVRGLSRFLSERPLDEKWLLAPSLRVGYQWLDQATRAGTPAVNVRVRGLAALALELASGEMDKRGLAYAGRTRRETILARVFAARKGRDNGYLSKLPLTPGLVEGLLRTITDLRAAGLSARDLPAGAFEVSAKAREIKAAFEDYEKAMAKERLADYADALRMAAARAREGDAVPSGVAVIVGEDMLSEFRGLERVLWGSLPEGSKLVLAVDRPGEEGAPSGPAEIFRAAGEANEVREVFRRLLVRGIPLDQVELVLANSESYLPPVYELARAWLAQEREEAPVTFSEGYPLIYTRPGRALLGWVELVRYDFPQPSLLRMVQDSLVQPAGEGRPEAGGARLAALFRSIPIGAGRERCRELVARALDDFKSRARHARPGEDDDAAGLDARKEREAVRLSALQWLDALVRGLVSLAPAGFGQAGVLEGALGFLDRHVRTASQLDQYSLHYLRREVREMMACLETGEVPGFEAFTWLEGLARQGRVGGAGPRPGCVFVSPLGGGGHSGRPHVFILGLDDRRFPGAGLQDPLLLDHERQSLSPELGTASARLARAGQDFSRLIARQRGRVCLSYSHRNLADDREAFPAAAVLSSAKTIHGLDDLSLEDLDRLLPEPAAFAPPDPDHALSGAEWWIGKVCARERPENAEAVAGQVFPHLGRGMAARAARASSRFTEYDGCVPEAGPDLDPTKPNAKPVSASALQTLAKNPMDYFFKYALKIEPPDEYDLDPEKWLDPLERGSLLHTVFYRFMTAKAGKPVSIDRDLPLIERILDEEIAKELPLHPQPSDMVFERERRDLAKAAEIFLREEDIHCRAHRPFCFEAAIGLPPDNPGTPLDTSLPVAVPLGDGRSIRARGRIDRVDEIGRKGSGRFAAWDYKTGSTWGYTKDPPFWAGRCIQNILYLDLLQARLDEIKPGARAERFGYFFPTSRSHGERIQWEREDLEPGRKILALLCSMIAAGAFPASNDASDYKYSDYVAALGDPGRVIAELALKLGDPENDALKPYLELRGAKPKKG